MSEIAKMEGAGDYAKARKYVTDWLWEKGTGDDAWTMEQKANVARMLVDHRHQPDPAIVEAWERYRRIAWGSDTTDDERDAANWELIKVIRQHVEKGGENERAIRDGGKTVSVLRGSGENSQVQM